MNKLDLDYQITCPICGDKLTLHKTSNLTDDNYNVRFYVNETNPNYRYMVHKYEQDIFKQVYGGNRVLGCKVLSYWKLKKDYSWEQVTFNQILDQYLPITTSKSEIDELINKKRKKDEIDFSKFYLPKFKKTTQVIGHEVKTIAQDLVAVQAMSYPISPLTFSYEQLEEKIIYPYIVSEENIEIVKNNFDKLEKTNGDIQIGDIVDTWGYGGPLSSRFGECIIRNGIEIYDRLTGIS